MITRDLWHDPSGRNPAVLTRQEGAWRPGWRRLGHCRCCGFLVFSVQHGPAVRCPKHADRNPCAIEGCKRTTEAPRGQLTTEDWLCGMHWKIGCPPHSAERRAYHRFWRVAKRRGWDEQLTRRFWRYWRGLVARARRRCAGDLDVAEINRLMGWDE